MLTPEKFVAEWPTVLYLPLTSGDIPIDQRLICVDREELENLPLPETAKDFLSRAGLPRKAMPVFKFEFLEEGLYTVEEGFAEGEWEGQGHLHDYYVLGMIGGGGYMCMQPHTGTLYSFYVPEEGKEDAAVPLHYVNADIMTFAEFLLVTTKSLYQYPDWDSPSFKDAIDRVVEYMLEQDRASLDIPDCLWAGLIDEVKNPGM
jgi:hypothetical protein